MKKYFPTEPGVVERTYGGYSAKIIADSVPNGEDDARLTTIEATFPRFILAEMNTHRQWSRNSASSRAIPLKKRIRMVRESPFVPEQFCAEQSGMQAGAALSDEDHEGAVQAWNRALDACLEAAEDMVALGVHKQWSARLLELFSWHTVVITSVHWENFFAQRDHSAAQPEMQVIAALMESVYKASTPRELKQGEWHLPYILEEEHDGPYMQPSLAKISAARCARVSYLNHDGTRDYAKDLELYEKLKQGFHMSPFEHPAQYKTGVNVHVGAHKSNFGFPWVQLRKMIPGEAVAPREKEEK